MIDVKILGASFAALIIISSLVIGSSGIGDFFSNIFNKISEWFGSSPFGIFFSTPAKREYSVQISLHPQNFSLDIKGDRNISIDSTNLTDFSGNMFVNFEDNVITFNPINSKLKISSEIKEISMVDIEISSIQFNNIKFEVTGINTTDKGNIDIQNFFGKITIKSDVIELSGNISNLKTKIGDLEWKLA